MNIFISFIYLGRYIIYMVLLCLAFQGFSFYIVPLIAILISLFKDSVGIRLNILMGKWLQEGLWGIVKTCPIFYLEDLVMTSMIYGAGLLAQGLIL